MNIIISVAWRGLWDELAGLVTKPWGNETQTEQVYMESTGKPGGKAGPLPMGVVYMQGQRRKLCQ